MINPDVMEHLKRKGIEPSIWDCHDEQCIYTSLGRRNKLTVMVHVPLQISATGSGKRLMQCPNCKTLRVVEI